MLPLIIILPQFVAANFDFLVSRLADLDHRIDLASNLDYIQGRDKFLHGVRLKNTYHYPNMHLQDFQTIYVKSLGYPQQQLLFCLQGNSTILILNMLGIIVAEYHHSAPILLQDLYHSQEEFYLGLYDINRRLTLLNLTVTYISVQDKPQDDIRLVDSSGAYAEFNFTVAAQFALDRPATAILVNQGRNQRVFIVGDELGNVTNYYQNGTAKLSSNLSKHPIIGIVRRHPHILFHTKNKLGFINSVSLQPVTPKCEQPAAPIRQIFQENMYGQTIYMLLQNQDVLVYQLKSGKHQECVISYKIHLLELPKEFRVANSYLIAYGDVSVQIYNTSLYKAYYQDEMILLNSLDDTYFHFNYYSVRAVKVGSTLTTAYEVIHQGSSTIIRQLELQHSPMQISTSFSLMESFRFPMILVAIFVVFIFQFWQKKNKAPDGEELSMETKRKIDEMVMEYSRKEHIKLD